MWFIVFTRRFVLEILKRMTIVLDYIEENITNEIEYEEIAQKIYCSSFDFHRMFSFICGISVSEYIRRRRLTLAALEFANKDVKVINVAFKYGYSSPVSFAKAFRKLHGISPSMAFRYKDKLKAYPKMSLQIQIRGDNEMEYRIEKKTELKFFGYEAIISNIDEEEYYENPGMFWQELQNTNKFDKIINDTGYSEHQEFKELCRVHAIMNYKETPSNTFSYMIGAFLTEKSKVDGYTQVTLPETTYAIFPSPKFKWDEIGKVISKMNERIYKEWFPTTNYEKANNAELEIYGGTEEAAYIELWIPIKEK